MHLMDMNVSIVDIQDDKITRTTTRTATTIISQLTNDDCITVGDVSVIPAYVIGQQTMLFYSILADKLKGNIDNIDTIYFQDYVQSTLFEYNRQLRRIYRHTIVRTPRKKRMYNTTCIRLIYDAIVTYNPGYHRKMPYWVYADLIVKTRMTSPQISNCIKYIKKGKYNTLLNINNINEYI